MHQDNVAQFISHDYTNITYRTNTWTNSEIWCEALLCTVCVMFVRKKHF